MEKHLESNKKGLKKKLRIKKVKDSLRKRRKKKTDLSAKMTQRAK